MKKTIYAAIAVASLFTPGSEAKADLTYGSLGCSMLTGSVMGGLVGMASSTNPPLAALVLRGGLATGISATTYYNCGQAVSAVVNGYGSAMRQLGYKLTWGSLPWPQRAACQLGDPSCFPQPSAEIPGVDPELDLFIQQSWDAVTQGVLAVADGSTSAITTTTSAYEFAQQLESSYHAVGVIPGFAAPANRDMESTEAQ